MSEMANDLLDFSLNYATIIGCVSILALAILLMVLEWVHERRRTKLYAAHLLGRYRKELEAQASCRTTQDHASQDSSRHSL